MATFSSFVFSLVRKPLLVVLAVVNVAGCSGSQPQQFNGDAKVSSDGSLIAVMERGKAGVELKVKKLNSNLSDWQKIPIPATSGSFNFSQLGKNILITYLDGQSGILAKVDLGNANKLTELYRSELSLAFPSEISSEKYLIQAVTRVTPNGYPMHRWKVITVQQSVADVGEEFGPPYSNVSLVRDSGFFIVTDADGIEKTRQFALPNGVTPNIKKYVAPETVDLTCDRSLENCIQVNRYLDESGYFFKLVRISNSEKCEMQGFPRWNQRVSITPDGKHALVVASRNSQTRPVLELVTFVNNVCTNFIKTSEEF